MTDETNKPQLNPENSGVEFDVNDTKALIDLYQQGLSIPVLHKKTGIALSTIRNRLKAAGVLRDRKSAVQLAGSQGRLGSGLRGKKRTFSKEHIENMTAAIRASADKRSKGVSLKQNGYMEYTRGEHKGKSVHVVVMEKRIGRALKGDEVVHHIDGDKLNNSEDNLALCTRAGHGRLHRREEQLAGITRERNEDGTWS